MCGEGNILTLHNVHKWVEWVIFLIYFITGIFATLVSYQSKELEFYTNSTWALAKRPLPTCYMRADTFPIDTIPVPSHVPATSLMSLLHCLPCLSLSGQTESPCAFWPCPASASDFYPTLLLPMMGWPKLERCKCSIKQKPSLKPCRCSVVQGNKIAKSLEELTSFRVL